MMLKTGLIVHEYYPLVLFAILCSTSAGLKLRAEHEIRGVAMVVLLLSVDPGSSPTTQSHAGCTQHCTQNFHSQESPFIWNALSGSTSTIAEVIIGTKMENNGWCSFLEVVASMTISANACF